MRLQLHLRYTIVWRWRKEKEKSISIPRNIWDISFQYHAVRFSFHAKNQEQKGFKNHTQLYTQSSSPICSRQKSSTRTSPRSKEKKRDTYSCVINHSHYYRPGDQRELEIPAIGSEQRFHNDFPRYSHRGEEILELGIDYWILNAVEKLG